MDVRDSEFWNLQLWTDFNHDGVPQPGELAGLNSKGIFAISLDFSESAEVDVHGNLLKFISPAFARTRRRPVRIDTTDVMLNVIELDEIFGGNPGL